MKLTFTLVCCLSIALASCASRSGKAETEHASIAYCEEDLNSARISATFQRINGETDDNGAIDRALQTVGENGTLYFPARFFSLSRTVKVKNVNLIFDMNTSFQPSSTFSDGESGDYLFSVEIDNKDHEIFKIEGGRFYLNHVANGIRVFGGHSSVLSEMYLQNPKMTGLELANRSKLFAHDIVVRDTNGEGRRGQCGIVVRETDHVLTDCSVSNVKTGFLIAGGSHQVARCHYWNIVESQNYQTTAFDIRGNNDSFIQCYDDTANIGFSLLGELNRFVECCAFINTQYNMTAGTIFHNPNQFGATIIGGSVSPAKETVIFDDLTNIRRFGTTY